MKRMHYGAIIILASMVLLSGCANRFNQGGMGQAPAAPQTVAAPQPEVPPSPVYLDFNDVLVPPELKRSTGESYLSNGFGRLVLSGRVDGDSLAKFFISGMPSTGWQTLDQYKYSGAIKLFFAKPDKISTILITENPMDTKVEIWVTPLKPH
jgi:hypothetical protein